MDIQIINSGIGNIASVSNMLKKIGFTSQTVQEPDFSKMFDLTILPGVGSFDNGMRRLNELGWSDYLKMISEDKKKRFKILGICLGMQLLSDGSEEGNLEGLSLIPGFFKRIKADNKDIKIPHMGWNEVKILKSGKILWPENDIRKPKFYFVHSYSYSNISTDFICGQTEYGGNSFASIISKDNSFGFQFHPEKSHSYGMTILEQFISSNEQ